LQSNYAVTSVKIFRSYLQPVTGFYDVKCRLYFLWKCICIQSSTTTFFYSISGNKFRSYRP